MNKIRDEAMVMTTVLISPLHPLQSGPQGLSPPPPLPPHSTTQLNAKKKKGRIFTIDPTTLEIVNFSSNNMHFCTLTPKV